MPYCLKCGSKVEDTMTFCSECGTQLKGEIPSAAPSPEPSEKQQNAQEIPNPQTQTPTTAPLIKMQQKPELGFIRYLVSGLILITVGVSAILELTNPGIAVGTLLAFMLLTIGLIVILGSVYYALSGRKRGHVQLAESTEKKASQPEV